MQEEEEERTAQDPGHSFFSVTGARLLDLRDAGRCQSQKKFKASGIQFQNFMSINCKAHAGTWIPGPGTLQHSAS